MWIFVKAAPECDHNSQITVTKSRVYRTIPYLDTNVYLTNYLFVGMVTDRRSTSRWIEVSGERRMSCVHTISWPPQRTVERDVPLRCLDPSAADNSRRHWKFYGRQKSATNIAAGYNPLLNYYSSAAKFFWPIPVVVLFYSAIYCS